MHKHRQPNTQASLGDDSDFSKPNPFPPKECRPGHLSLGPDGQCQCQGQKTPQAAAPEEVGQASCPLNVGARASRDVASVSLWAGLGSLPTEG